MSDGRQTICQSYLLRLWPVDGDGRTYWRASLQDVASGRRQGFENLENLFAYLCEETELTTQRLADGRPFPMGARK